MSDPRQILRAHDLSHILKERGWYHSMTLPGGEVIVGLQPEEVLRRRVAAYPIPDSLAGKRVLDIGAWDGWFTFEMERRGATVVSIDNTQQPTFHYAHAKLRSQADYREMDVYEIDPESLGRFDFVLLLGVHYHLKHPLLALEKVCSVTEELAIVEGFIADEAGKAEGHSAVLPWLHFYETDELGGQTDNWFGPSLAALEALCRTAGFARVELLYAGDQRAALACWRHWLPVAEICEPAPLICGAVNSRTRGMNFLRRFDDYICCWLTSPVPDLDRNSVFPEVGGYGILPVHVLPVGPETWQVTFAVPQGLGPGWHKVRLRTAASPFSAEFEIALDVPVEAPAIAIAGVCDNVTWKVDEADRTHPIAIWVSSLPRNADVHNVRPSIDGHRLFALFVSEPDVYGRRQVNALIPKQVEAGMRELVVEAGQSRTAPAILRLT